MSRWSEREIARKLAERDELEPPPGLLEKIKSEIPPMIPAGTDVPEIDRRPSMPPRQRWLIAASLVAMVGAGLFALRVKMEVPPVEYAARPAAGARQPERRQMPNPTAPPPAKLAPERQAFQHQLREAPAAKQQLQRKEKEALKALGYISSKDEKKAERGDSEGAVGGEPGSAPAAPPVAAAPPPPPPAPAVQEAPLLDERRAEERDRINVGGNESGRQDLDKGPGTANRPQPAPASRAKVAGAGPLWQVPASQPIILQTDADTSSYVTVRRSIDEGKLPDPAVVRIGQIVNAFETGDVPPVEGAFTPFVHGPQYRLLRVHPAGAGPAQVSFNPSVVVRYRSIGTGGSALYEIELRPDVSPQDALVAVLHLGNQGKAMTAGDLAASWPQASPGFRLTALAAEFAEILKGSPVDSSALHRLSAEIGKLPKSAKAAELADLVEKAGRIRR